MIKLIVLDVDGTLTNGKITYTNSGDEIKSFDVKDGLAIASWNRLKGKSAIITGRSSKIVEKRANDLKIDFVYQGVKDKKEILLKIIDELNLDNSEVAVIGDDLNDLGMFELIPYSFAPKDASSYIKEKAKTTLNKNGGDGAVREMIEIILKQDNRYKEFLDLWH